MVKRSILWVLAAYCIGIVFRDRLEWMLWAVLFSYAFFAGAVRFTLQNRKQWTNADRIQQMLKKDIHLFIWLPLVLLLGAFLGKLQEADYPIDAALTKKTAAVAEGRIRSITETGNGYRMELRRVCIILESTAETEADRTESGEVAAREETKGYTKGKLLVYCESAEGLRIGNYICLEGKAVPFEEPENAGQFDERTYYRAKRMCCKFNADTITVLDAGVDEIREWCRMVCKQLDSIYEEILPQKHAGIVSAILLGDKAELDADTKALYQKNGIAHILAISGLHVSLLGMGLFAIIRKIGSPLIPAAAATMLILVFYGCLTEFSVSTQRAVGMLLIAMFARILGRTYDSRSACALCGLLILIANPMQLYQAGFQLSFGAAFGISYFGCELERMKLSKGKTATEKLKVSVLSGMTTQLITAPIILNCFYELPVYSVLLNLPVIGLLSSVVFLSILAGFAGIFSYAFGRFLAGGVYVILELYELLCRITEKLPCPIWLYGRPQDWRVAVYYFVLVLFFAAAKQLGKRYRHHPRQHQYRRRAFLVLGLLPLVFVRSGGWSGDADENAERMQGRNTYSCIVDFLSVGQGDCAVVRTKNGSAYLIDCGSSSVRSVGEYRLKPWLKYHWISKLEAVFLSHPDSDHTNGVLELLEKTNSPDDWYRGEIQIRNLVLPAIYRKEVENAAAEEKAAGGEDGTENNFIVLYRLAQKNGISVLWFDAGDKVTENGFVFTCLHPEIEYSVHDTNDASMVLLFECISAKILFTGDIGRSGEKTVGLRLGGERESDDTATVILKVAHHGSKNSSSERFLKLVEPDVAIISCGKDNQFGHPHEETVERLQKEGSKVIVISECGTVTVHIGENENTVISYK